MQLIPTIPSWNSYLEGNCTQNAVLNPEIYFEYYNFEIFATVLPLYIGKPPPSHPPPSLIHHYSNLVYIIWWCVYCNLWSQCLCAKGSICWYRPWAVPGAYQGSLGQFHPILNFQTSRLADSLSEHCTCWSNSHSSSIIPLLHFLPTHHD